MSRPWSRGFGRLLRQESGYTLFELIVVMVILGVVLLGMTTSFAAGLSAESGTIKRVVAQENARLALNRMRVDIHCASAAPAPQENPLGGFTLTLTESPGVCPSVTTSSSGVQWCTIPVTGATNRWQLFRFLGTVLADCDGSASATLVVDYLVTPDTGWSTNTAVDPVPADWDGNIWPDPPTCSAGNLPAVSVRMSVNPDPVAQPALSYEVSDTIALRNATRCT
jgi:prepilin-type N-terminal cleavage/methylation domain-containing protein